MNLSEMVQLGRHNPKPFIWTARASDILEKIKRARRALHKTSICMTHNISATTSFTDRRF